MKRITSALVAAASGVALALVGPTATALAVAVPELCQGQTPTIVATSNNMKLQGTEGADVISTAGFRGVEVHGLAGDDLICASARRSAVLDGGSGDDSIVDLEAGAGTSERNGSLLLDGPGNDRYVGVRGTVLSFQGRATGVRIDLRAGTVIDGADTDRISNIHTVRGTAHPDTFIGTAFADRYQSSAHDEWDRSDDTDTIFAGAGADDIEAYGGTVWAGAGDDRVFAAGGAIVHGGPGDDSLHLHQGGRLLGGTGNDTITAADTRESDAFGRTVKPRFWLLGGSGNDIIQPPRADDQQDAGCPETCARGFLRGGSGRDTLDLTWRRGAVVDLATGRARVHGGHATLSSFENVRGSQVRDVIRGNAGRNRLEGRGGDDVLVGRGGRDVLLGGPGRDRADGGPGPDRCTAEARTSCRPEG